MKKLLVLPLMIWGMGLCAQQFQLGLKGGLNISNFANASFNNVDQKALLGFHGGAFMSLYFGEHFAIQPEAVFSSQGAKLKRAGQEDNFRLHYLNVPVLLKYRFNGGFYLEAGPQFGFLLSESVPENSVESFAKNLDLAFDAGLGYHSPAGFGVGGRYIAGMSKVGNFDEGDLNPDFRNGVIQLFVFFTLFNNHLK